ncbi:cache domain-containing protein [Pontibacter ruber]|uniref:Cache domain-containing protein n=1 Tax=Pontibacter ruber TaxID=1343895 RepID=A0ABW5CZN0_9BACT|nr:cache domain-containing protein [Pontibacter ruber]
MKLGFSLLFAALIVWTTCRANTSKNIAARQGQQTQQDSTKLLVQLVKDASEQVRKNGEKAFTEFREKGSRWRKGETYIFVLDTKGNMLVHNDPEMENKNQLQLKDINGKPIVRGLISAATTQPDKPEGWYHYEWPVPGGLLPRWKSSYVRLVKAPSGKSYVVGSGMYNDRMERAFVVDLVTKGVAEVEQHGEAAYKTFHDPTGPYLAKDAYIFVFTMEGVEIVNPAFPTVEGNNNYDMKDAEGKYLVREILKTATTKGAGWVDYMWPKPGESIPTQKSAFVHLANMPNGKQVVVGCGVYLADAPKAKVVQTKMSATELMTLVRQAAAELEKRGEKAFPDFSKKGSKWYQDDTYLFVNKLNGGRVFLATQPQTAGQQDTSRTDAVGRPVVKMFTSATASPEGEGWVHYEFPKPGDIFPTWKSSFVKRITFPSGEQYIVGSGIYNMQMDKTFIEDVVNRAAALVEKQGKGAFDQLRDKKGPFYFMDTYVFVESPEGVELANTAQPSLEGRNLIKEKDLKGKLMVRDYIDAAMKNGAAWVDYYWYKPGENTPARKRSYVKKVQHGNETYIIGSGYYPAEEAKGARAGGTRE